MNFKNLTPGDMARLNRDPLLTQKFLTWKKREHKKMAEVRLKERRLVDYLYCHGQGHIFGAFLHILETHKLSGKEYWECARQAWVMSEWIAPNFLQWCLLFQYHRRTRHLMMTESERKYLVTLPNEMTIYRGAGAPGHVGLSWTLSRNNAEWFAHYACGPRRVMLGGPSGLSPTVICGTVEKRYVIAFVNARKEREIITWPNKVRNRFERSLKHS